MCLRALGFVLILFPGVLQAQGCDAPTLRHGNFLPKQATYSHEATITYACENGYKPAVEGWWATSTCQNGRWAHEPQCIEESACLPPTIPNAKYRENSNGWYEDGRTLRITCDAGFEHKNQNTTTTCENGNWSPLPVCERSISACSTPPKISHAVVINQGHQEVFAAGSEVQYHCEHGYTNTGQNSIICEAGQWTTGPTCKSSNGRETNLGYITIDNCGAPPFIHNGVVTETTPFYLRYQCQQLYRLEGSDRVNCVSGGVWSNLPNCRADFCAVNTDDKPEYKSVGTVYVRYGEEHRVECVKPSKVVFDHHSKVRCINGRVEATECCSWWEHKRGCDLELAF